MFEKLIKNYLMEWHTKKDAIKYLKENDLKLNEREFRKRVEIFNQRYFREDSELFIAHSSKGYILTSDKNIISKSIKDDRKRALRLLERYQKTVKKLSNADQINLEVYPIEEDTYELLMKIERN